MSDVEDVNMVTSLHELEIGLAGRQRRRRVVRAAVSGVSGLGAQAIGIAVAFISVPLTVGYLGPERYGIWIALSSLIAWLAVSDVGFGSALINALAEADGTDNRATAGYFVATAIWFLSAISVVILAAGLAVIPFVDWHTTLRTTTSVANGEINAAASVTIVMFAISFPASVVDSIYRGYQEGYKSNAWTIAGSVASLIALLVVVHFSGGIALLALALLGPRTVLRIANLVYCVGLERPWLLPKPNRIRKVAFVRLWSLGANYLVQQIGNIAMFQAQPLIVARARGTTAVGIFNVTYRLLTLPQFALLIATTPLIGAYGEARARKDWSWIRRTAILSTVGCAVAATLMTVPLAVYAPEIIARWAGASLVPTRELVEWLAAYTIAAGVATPLAVLLQGLEAARALAIVAVATGAITIGLAVLLAPTHGMSGVAASMFIALVLANCLPQVAIAWSLLGRRLDLDR